MMISLHETMVPSFLCDFKLGHAGRRNRAGFEC
jgi:hypothetical protein